MQVFEIDSRKCRGSLECMRVCPVRAVGRKNGKTTIDADRCISCGACYSVCSRHAVLQISQTERVKEFIRAKRKVILSMDPACLAFLPENVTLEKLAAAVQELGVWDVADASEAAAAAASEYGKLMREGRMENIIFSHCPVVRKLAESYYPGAVKYIAPVASPMIIHGRMLKRDFTSAAVVYVSTCAGRLQESQDVRHSTEINAVLSIGELMEWLNQEGIDPAAYEPEPLLSDGGGVGLLSAVSGGMLEAAEYFTPEHSYRKFHVSGMSRCRALLSDLQEGKLKGCLIEMSACPGGCVGGMAGFRQHRELIGPFVAGMTIRDELEKQGREPYFDTHGIALATPAIESPRPAYAPDKESVDEMLKMLGHFSERLQKNCGACGYKTCRERAIAVLKGEESAVLCPMLQKETGRDLYHTIYEQLPQAVMTIDDSQRITHFNREARALFGLKEGEEKYIFELIDPGDVQYVLSTGLAVRNRRYDIPELFLHVEADIAPMKGEGGVLAIFEDITALENEEERRMTEKMHTVDMAQKLIDKQMSVAQQIAFLLGETTAETKVTLNQLKNRILGDEEEQG